MVSWLGMGAFYTTSGGVGNPKLRHPAAKSTTAPVFTLQTFLQLFKRLLEGGAAPAVGKVGDKMFARRHGQILAGVRVQAGPGAQHAGSASRTRNSLRRCSFFSASSSRRTSVCRATGC